jgi:hypothetical protein
MFKYVEGILSKFNIGQRVFVLFQLLFFITLVYLGPKILQSYKPENDSLTQKIVNLEEFIIYLEGENRKKSEIIRSERVSCTNQIVDRENQFIQMLTELENGVNNNKRKKRELVRNSRMLSEMVILDTVDMFNHPSPIILEEEVIDTDDYVINSIKKYKETVISIKK